MGVHFTDLGYDQILRTRMLNPSPPPSPCACLMKCYMLTALEGNYHVKMQGTYNNIILINCMPRKKKNDKYTTKQVSNF